LNCKPDFYEVADDRVKNLALNGWGKYAWYRLFLPELLSEHVDRILYLDVDTIICGDITELYNMDLTDCSLAGCMDYMGFYDGIYQRVGYQRKFGYVCSGVILFNLDYFRKHNLSKQIIDFSLKYPERINFPDQDAINAVCHESMKLLPLKYDMTAPFFTDKTFISKNKEEVEDMLHDPRIIHYAGCNPWKYESEKHYYYDEFWKYASKVGGIRRKRMITGTAWVKHKVKVMLGILGLENYKKFAPKPKPDFSMVEKLKGDETKN